MEELIEAINKAVALDKFLELSIKRYEMEKDGRNISDLYLSICRRIGKFRAEILQ